MDPRVPDSHSLDDVAPDWTGEPTVVYSTQNTIKLEFHTTEPVRADISVSGRQTVERLPLKPHFDSSFSIALDGLEPGRSHEFGFDLSDIAGNITTRSFIASTRPRVQPAPWRRCGWNHWCGPQHLVGIPTRP